MHRRPLSLRGLLLAVLVLATLSGPARGQLPPPTLDDAQSSAARDLPAADALSDRTAVWVITLGLGDQPHTLFGHTAVVVRDPTLAFSVAFNYGTFAFGDGFLLQFLGGRLDYHLSVTDGWMPLREAMRSGRGHIRQRLDLTPTQSRMLYRELRREAQPEHREYRYRFLDRNCSTKVIDVLERALGDALQWPSSEVDDADETDAHPATYRELLRGHLRDRPWYRLGIDLMLGRPTDRHATGRRRGFLPIHLAQLLDGTLVQSGGAARPLVSHREAEAFRGLPETTRRTPLWAALSLLALGFVSTATARWKPAAMRWPMRIFDGLLLLGTGLAGLAIAGMWAFSAHGVIGPNANLLWAVPLHLVAAAWVIQRPAQKWLRIYLAVAAVLATGVTLAWPWIPQGMPTALWPVAGLIAVRCTHRAAAPQQS